MLRKVTGAAKENKGITVAASVEIFGEKKIILRCSGRSCGGGVKLLLSAGDGADDQEGFFAGGDGGGERGVGRIVGEIFLAGEEAEEGATLLRDVVADGALQDRIAGFEGVEDGADRDGAFDFERDFAGDLGESAEVRWKDDLYRQRLPPEAQSTRIRSHWPRSFSSGWNSRIFVFLCFPPSRLLPLSHFR